MGVTHGPHCPNIQCVKPRHDIHVSISEMPKRGRDGIYKSPAAKKARRDAVSAMMSVMDKVATGQAVVPRTTNYVVRYPGPNAGFRPSSAGRTDELKGVDTLLTQAGPIVSTTSTNDNIVCVNLVAPGTGSFNRVGRKIFMKNLRLRVCALYTYGQANTTSNITFPLMRCVVVYDRQTNGSIPTWVTMFATKNQAGSEDGNVIGPLSYDGTRRFVTLMDEIVEARPVVDPAGAFNSTNNKVLTQVHFERFIPLRGLEVLYSGDSATAVIGDISSGGLYVGFRALGGTVDDVSDWSVTSLSYARLRYTD